MTEKKIPKQLTRPSFEIEYDTKLFAFFLCVCARVCVYVEVDDCTHLCSLVVLSTKYLLYPYGQLDNNCDIQLRAHALIVIIIIIG